MFAGRNHAYGSFIVVTLFDDSSRNFLVCFHGKYLLVRAMDGELQTHEVFNHRSVNFLVRPTVFLPFHNEEKPSLASLPLGVRNEII
jgi:hypothetical protein